MRSVIALLLAASAAVAEPPTVPAAAALVPAIFEPGAISTGDFESHPAFSRDGKTLYYLKDSPNFTFWTMVVSHLRDGKWQPPELAPWSGQYRDADPFITADGSRLYFISDRPVDGKPKEDLDIWYVEREGSSWSSPKHVEAPVNSPGNEWFPTIAADGTLYFGSDREGGFGRTDLYRCRRNGDTYGPAENLGAGVNTKFDEFEPLINADQSLLIFMATGRPEGKGGGDLYVSVSKDGAWQPARNLGEPINSRSLEISPAMSPDGRSFFFTSTRGSFNGQPLAKRHSTAELLQVLRGPGNGLGDIYQIDFRAVVAATVDQ